MNGNSHDFVDDYEVDYIFVVGPYPTPSKKNASMQEVDIALYDREKYSLTVDSYQLTDHSDHPDLVNSIVCERVLQLFLDSEE